MTPRYKLGARIKDDITQIQRGNWLRRNIEEANSCVTVIPKNWLPKCRTYAVTNGFDPEDEKVLKGIFYMLIPGSDRRKRRVLGRMYGKVPASVTNRFRLTNMQYIAIDKMRKAAVEAKGDKKKMKDFLAQLKRMLPNFTPKEA